MRDIITQRLHLRAYTLDDAPALFDYAKNPNVGPHAGWKPHESIDESREVIRDIFLPSEGYAIILKETGKVIGSIALEADKRRPQIKAREIGYSLAEECWGKGIMTEAAKAVIDFGFEELGLQVISICTSEVNIRSQRVIDKCGFHYEGTERACFVIYDGSVRDSRCYSMLRTEWEAKR
ncbi:MAG: GNAT family N-acetyltransferase [Eubacteriales bacterium]